MINLTEKERKVIELKAKGCTHKQVAQALITNVRYVKIILDRLYKKTSTKNSNHLTAWAYENDILKINYQKLSNTQESGE
jgi:DNA-binding CsgD family transcriptional regulator